MDVQALEVINACRHALRRQGRKDSATAIARLTGYTESEVNGQLKATTAKLKPHFVRRLAEEAGLSVSEQFHKLGWLPGRELPERELLELGREIGPAARRLAEAMPYFERMARPTPAAPFTAAEVLQTDRRIPGRFDVRLSQIVSGERYQTVTNHVAHVTLREGQRPLPIAEARQTAADAGVAWWPDETGVLEDESYWSLRLELMARTHRALHDGQEYSWQGGPRHLTWRPAVGDGEWPAQLLVQDAIGGRQGPIANAPVRLHQEKTIVFVGGRHGLGLAAAMLAEALGRQYVLIRELISINEAAFVRRSEGEVDRTEAWAEATRVIERRGAEPWPAVLLVRPAVFAGAKGPRALDLLRNTSAQVVYARPPDAYLDWWTKRSAGLYDPGDPEPIERGRRTRGLYDQIDEALHRRNGGEYDLLLDVPSAKGALPAHTPEIPAEVMDWSARVAWRAAQRLCRDVDDLRPGLISNWQERLSADPLKAAPAGPPARP